MTNHSIFLLGEAHIEPLRGVIRVGRDERHIEPQTMAVLVHLCQHPGQVITREALLDAVWAGCIVNDGAVSKAICLLRKALGDQARQPRYIQTIPKVGYRLIAPVGAFQASSNAGAGIAAQGESYHHKQEDRPSLKKSRLSVYAKTAAKYMAFAGIMGLAYTLRPTTIEIEKDITFFPSVQHNSHVIDSTRVKVDSVFVEEEVFVYQLSSMETETSP